jgi:cysteinyl-tRNA synthetase
MRKIRPLIERSRKSLIKSSKLFFLYDVLRIKAAIKQKTVKVPLHGCSDGSDHRLARYTRARKDWETSDKIRDELQAAGIS